MLTLQPVFFFQAEDGIRDYKVTGVQTCALPISFQNAFAASLAWSAQIVLSVWKTSPCGTNEIFHIHQPSAWCCRTPALALRSEERRVGKEWRCGGGGDG